MRLRWIHTRRLGKVLHCSLRGREILTVLYHQHNLSLARLQQFKDRVLIGSHCAGVVNGQNLVSGFYPAVDEGRLVLDDLLDVDPSLVGRLLD